MTDTEVLSLAQWLLVHYDSPLVPIRSMACDNTYEQGANLPQMLGRKLLDRITVKWQPMDGPLFTSSRTAPSSRSSTTSRGLLEDDLWTGASRGGRHLAGVRLGGYLRQRLSICILSEQAGAGAICCQGFADGIAKRPHVQK